MLIAVPGHGNASVRRSCALSFSEALDTHPDHQASLLITLKELYREKVGRYLCFRQQYLLTPL
jgi:hypothetical protein